MPLPECDKSSTPYNFNILCQIDKDKYLNLKNYLSSCVKRCENYTKVSSLNEKLSIIYSYCIRNDEDDWKRCLVCGIYWIGEDIVINTHNLSLLVCKCKSSINGALSQMGYITQPLNYKFITNHIPFLKGKTIEQKQWNIRRRNKCLFSKNKL